MNTHSSIKRLIVGKYTYVIIHYKIKQNLIRENTLLPFFEGHMSNDGLYLSTAPIKDYQQKNLEIRRAKSLMDGYLMYNESNTNKLPTQEGYKQYKNDKQKNKSNDYYIIKGKEVTEYFELYIESKRKSHTLSTGTLKHLTTQLNGLKKYENTLSKKLVFDDINMTFSLNYTDYLYKKGMKAGSINKRFDILKAVLKFYEEYPEFNVKVNPAYKTTAFNSQRKSENLPNPLTREEFKKLRTFNFDSEILNITRDMFILACCTGLRYSDLFTINDNMIINDCLHISPVKTINRKKKEKNLLKINLNDISRTILQKHNKNTQQYYMNPVKYRGYLTKMCKQAGIKDYASHSCRDTFITFCIEEKMSIPILMSFTGHTKYEDLAKYIRINEQQQQSEMNQVTTFKL